MPEPSSRPASQAALALQFARAVVQAGVQQVIVSPGSRSTPLLWAFGQTDATLTPVVDERAAAFYALGIARVSDRPVALVCTSGTAGAHYLPALIEAQATGFPLLAITADRSFDRHGNGSSQTIPQASLFGPYVGGTWTLPVDAAGVPAARLERAAQRIGRQAVQAAVEQRAPVHVNAPLHKPLEPDAQSSGTIALPRSTAAVAPSHGAAPDAIGRVLATLRRARRPVIVAGPGALRHQQACDALAAFAAHLEIPVLADVSSSLSGPHAVGGMEPILRALPDELAPDVVFQLGAVPVAGAWARALDARPPRAHIVWTEVGWPDSENTAHEVTRVGSLDAAVELLAAAAHSIALPIVPHEPDASAENPWRARQAAVRQARVAALDGMPLSGPQCAESILTICETTDGPMLLCLGNSTVVRDFDDTARTPSATTGVLTQRGVAGIDGIVSAAAGAGAASQLPTCVVHGDVSAVHDLHGLVLAREASAPLAIVVIDNDGGRIFEQLPAADHPATRADLERLWVTPTGIDSAAVARSLGLESVTVSDAASLEQALLDALRTPGATVVRALVRPADDRLVRARLSEHVRDALQELA